MVNEMVLNYWESELEFAKYFPKGEHFYRELGESL